MPARTGETNSERCLLQALLDGPPHGSTRAELQERTGLSPATLVTYFRQKGEAAGAPPPGRLSGLVEVLGGQEGGADRYRLRGDAAFALGIDLSRRLVRVGLGSAAGGVLSHPYGQRWEKSDETIDVDAEAGKAMDRAADMAAEIVHEAQARAGGGARLRLAGIGVALTGAIEPETGLFRPGRLVDDWEGLRVETELRWRLEQHGIACSMILDKDSNHCATGFKRSVAANGIENFVFVLWEQGVGAGLVLGGRLQRGVRTSAGAIGHSPIVRVLDNKKKRPSELWEPSPAIRCERCAKQDCLEAIIGVDRLRRVVAERRGLDGGDEANWPSLADLQAAALANPEADEGLVLCAAAKRLGNALGTVANLLNPQLIVVGGAFGRAHGGLLTESVREGLRDVCTAPAYRDVDLQFSDLGTIDGAIASVIASGAMSSSLLSL